MTFRERLTKEHPDEIDEKYDGGCCGCPCDYGYENWVENYKYCESSANCTDCWNREMEEKEMANIEVCESCEVKSYPTVKEIIGSNYGLIKELESTLHIIAMEIKKTDVPELNDLLPVDMIDAISEHNRLLVRCLDHARNIKYHLGIGDL